VAPTGAGKTVILGDTVAAHRRHNANARVNVYAHRRELLTQAADTFRAFGLEVGIAGEGRHHPVQVLSTQAVLSRGEVDSCTMAVFDEAHHYAADTWGDVAKTHKEHGAIIVGATATPERGDGRPLDHMFDAIVVVAQVRELVDLGALVPCSIIKPVRSLRAGQIAQAPHAAYARYAPGRRAVVFAPHVKAAEEYASGFANARVIHAKSTDREESLAAFRSGECPVLVNVNVLTEGWDCPACDCVILARGMGSVGMMIQACGRAARPHPGKSGYLVIDLRGITVDLGRPDADRVFSLTGEGISRGDGVIAEERLCKMCQAVLGEEETCPACGTFNGLEVPKVVGVELEAWNVRYQGDGDDDRVARLAKWLRLMLMQGKSGRALFAAQYKYQATYKTKPDRATWDRAMAMARERRAG
jgi:superfamily II DNA or RNA helicase